MTEATGCIGADTGRSDRNGRPHPQPQIHCRLWPPATLPIGAFKAFPGHQYHMWKCDLRSAATFVSRFGDRPYGEFFIGDLQAEIAAKEGMLILAG